MSQTTSEIWTKCLQAPVSVWESQSPWEREPDEWPELVTDRLALAESDEADWKTIEYVAIAYQAGVVYAQLNFDFDIEEKFKQLSDRWRGETKYLSSLSKITMHPAYQKIIGMGERAVPLILREMQQRGGHWLWALHAITDEDPAPPNATFGEAVQAWLDWGRQRQYIR